MDNVVAALASTLLIGSSLFFHLTRTFIKAGMSLKFCRIRPRTYELAALEHLETFIFDWIFSILAGNKVNYKSLDGFKIWPDQTFGCGVSFP